MRFKEWFLYTRYREEIPKILLRLYFVVVIAHPSILAICFLLYFLGPYPEIGGNLAKGIMWFDVGWLMIVWIAFWDWPSSFPQVFPLDQKEAGHAAKTAEVRRLPLGKELSGVTPFGKICTPSFVE